MNEVTATYHPLGLTEKFRVLLGCGIAAALFWSVGWMVLGPVDPQRPVSLLFSERAGAGWAMMTFEAALLASVAAAIARVVAVPRLPHAGVFAVAVGLAALVLRGGTVTPLLLYVGGTDMHGRGQLCLFMAVEMLAWTVALSAAWLVDNAVGRWIAAGNESPLEGAATGPASKTSKAAPAERGQARLSGPLAMAVSVAVAFVLISLTITRTSVGSVQRGQVFFALAVGFYLGSLAASQVAGSRCAVWYMLAVVVAAMVGYAAGFLNPLARGAQDLYNELATTPPNGFSRALPIEYIGVGVAAAIAGLWSGTRMHLQHEPHGTS